LREKATHLTQAAQGGWQAVVPAEDAAMIAAFVGPNMALEEEAVEILRESGFRGADIFTEKLTQRRLSEACEDLVDDRDRLRKLLEALESTSSTANLVDALLGAARMDGASIFELLTTLIDIIPDKDIKQKVSDLCSNGIKLRYDRLLKRQEEITPKVQDWRETLQKLKDKSDRASAVQFEVDEAEDRLNKKEAKERDLVDSFEQRKQERHQRRTAKREAKRRKREELERTRKDPNASIDVSEYMSAQDKDRLYREENQYEAHLRKTEAQEKRAKDFEQQIEAADVMKQELLKRRRAAQDSMATLEQEVAEQRTQLESDEQQTKYASGEMKDLKKQLKGLQEEWAQATKPKGPGRDLSVIEGEIAEQEGKNQELRDEGAFLLGRVELYERRWDLAEGRVKKLEESAAEPAKAKKKVERPQSSLRRPSDPMLMEYRDRLELPEYSNLPRALNLYNDDQARDRKQRKRYEEGVTIENTRLFARQKALRENGNPALEAIEAQRQARASSSTSPAAAAHVPVGFMRLEDLRVKRAGAQRVVGQLAGELDHTTSRFAAAREELRRLGRQVGQHTGEAARVHSEVSDRLFGMLDEAASENIGQDDQARQALMAAAEEHRSALTRTEEAWHLAELLCERGAREHEIAAEGIACRAREEALTDATRRLYSTAARAAATGSEAVAGACRRCLADWDGAEQRLVASRAACGAVWPKALMAADGLDQEREMQDGLQTILRSEATRRDLLEAELVAPSEARRAFASIRAATSAVAAKAARGAGAAGPPPLVE